MKIFYFKRIKNKNVSRRKKIFIISIFIYICNIFYFNNILYRVLRINIINVIYHLKNKFTIKALKENEIFLKNLNNPRNKEMILKNGKKFIDKCLNEKNKNYRIKFKTIISSIIPVFNCEKTIRASINSIQNQNFTDFEIILINDCSKDNTSYIIENLQENDIRIKIINNKKNMGSLYSRSIGVLMSRGEYIFPLDNDDMFFDEHIFYSILKIAKESYLDVVGFRGIKMRDYRNGINQMRDLHNYQHHDNLIIRQPQLSSWFITIKGNLIFHDVTIWCKCIKTKVYKEAIIKLGFDRYKKFVSWAEDTSVNIIIFNIAKSFLFINIYGIAHLWSISTASYSQPIKIKFFGFLYLLDVLFDFSKNEDKIYSFDLAYEIKRRFKVKKFINDTNIIFFRNIVKKIANSKYIKSEKKQKIMKDFNFFFT